LEHGGMHGQLRRTLAVVLMVLFCLYFTPAREVVALIVGAILALTLIGLYFAPAAWVIGDAQKRGYAGGGAIVVALTVVVSPLSALIWFAIRPRKKLVDRAPEDYQSPDEAFSAAVGLDKLGEWDAANAVYEYAAQRWPEHQAYVAACLEEIKEKQSLA
jgi:uncharacterized membrane protein YedE/YeeE